jgi:small-conductance mechanosensitive channel
VHKRGRLTSALNVAIYDKLREHEVEIPFPQRDLHMRSGTLNVRLERARAQAD